MTIHDHNTHRVRITKRARRCFLDDVTPLASSKKETVKASWLEMKDRVKLITVSDVAVR